ncbi:hypothetical protein GWI33_002225, partial [Rhynchophorus ferrugineus]
MWVSCESSYYNQSMDNMDAGYPMEQDYYAPQSQSASRK